MRNLFLILGNCVRRSLLLIPGVLVMVALLTVVFFSGRQAAGMKDAADSIPVGIIDQDCSAASEDMISYMEEHLHMDLMFKEGVDAFGQLTTELLDCRISVILEIPEGLQEKLLSGEIPEVLMTSLDDYENSAFTEAYLENYLQRTALLARAAGGDEERFSQLLKSAGEGGLKIGVKEGGRENLQKVRDENGIALLTGFFTFMGFGASLFMGMLVLEDKRNGTFKRMQISNVKPVTYMAGIMLGNMCISIWIVVGVLTMLAFVKPVTDIPFWLIGVMFLEWILFSTGFQLMTAFLVKSSWVMITVNVGFVSIANILGGAYFPLGDNVLKRFSALTPQFYMMETIYGLQDDPGYAFGRNLWILLLMVVLVYLIAAVAFARREN